MTRDGTTIRFRSLPKLLSSAAFAGSLLFANAAYAVRYWDTNGATAGASASTTAAGTWDTTTTSWSTNSNGTSATAAWPTGETAVFSAATNATGSYTVSLAQSVTVSGITVEEGTPTINAAAGNPLVLLNNGALAVNTGSGSLHIFAQYGFN